MPSFSRFFRKALRVFLAILACLSALLITVHLVENWRGKRAWAQWKAHHEAMGVRYDPACLIPPTIPDDENFAKVPMIAQAIRGEDPKNLFNGFMMPVVPKVMGSWREGRPDDLSAWATASGAKDMAEVLRGRNEVLDGVAQASLRPRCRFDIEYTNPCQSFPVLLGFRAVARTFRLRAEWELDRLHPATASGDVLACLRIARHLDADQNWTTNLLQRAMVEITLQPIWEGLERQRWGDRELVAIQTQLQGINLLSAWGRTLEASRINEVRETQNLLTGKAWSIERAFTSRRGDVANGQDVSPIRLLIGWLIVPKGWVYQNMVSTDDFYLNGWQPVVDGLSHRVHPERMSGPNKWTGNMSHDPHALFTAYSKSFLMSETSRLTAAQAAMDQAIVACALERYRLACHAYPASLEDLVSMYLERIPQDQVIGGPLNHSRRAEGGFNLYAVGWDGKNHGGKVTLTEDGRPLVSTGDWIWPRLGLIGQIEIQHNDFASTWRKK